MNTGVHQYPQLQPLLFRLPDTAGRAQAVPKPRGQGPKIQGINTQRKSSWCLSLALGVQLSNASSLQSLLLWHWWLHFPAHLNAAVTLICSWAGQEADRHPKPNAVALVFLYSHGCTVSVRLLAEAYSDGDCGASR